MKIVDEQKHKREMLERTLSEGIATVGTQDFARRLVTTIKPRFAVENRGDTGFTFPLLQGLNDNGFGRLIVYSRDAEKCALLRKEAADLQFSPSVALDILNQSALESKFEGAIDLLVCSADHEQVVQHLLEQVNPFGLIVLYAEEGGYDRMREFALNLEKERMISVVSLPESRRLLMAQRRSGRK